MDNIRETLFPELEVERATTTSPRKRIEIFNDYDGFVEKFKPKKTTDDCYTPPLVYNVVKQWVNDNLCPLEGRRVLRPFYPGGDYEAVEYNQGDIVLDNPPFSILKKIIEYYVDNGVDFFLFAPALTLFNGSYKDVSFIVTNCSVVFENGAVVRIGFVTNLEKKHRIIVDGNLSEMIKEANRKPSKALKKKIYPMQVCTAALLQKIARPGIVFKIPMDECFFIGYRADCGIDLYGGGYLISERAAAERAAAERVELSERELAIIKAMSKKDGV